MTLHEVDGEVGFVIGLVAGHEELLGGVAEVPGVCEVHVEVVGGPVLESLAPQPGRSELGFWVVLDEVAHMGSGAELLGFGEACEMLARVGEVAGTEMPFADESGAVSCAGEESGDAVARGVDVDEIEDDAAVSGVATGDEHGARGCADGTSGESVGEEGAFGGETVDVGGLDVGFTVA